MNAYRNTEKDIHSRIYRFVIGCFKNVIKKIPKSTENISVIGQLSASLTSMGANDTEADAAASRKDFVAKYTIVRKETRETLYWLSVVCDVAMLDRPIVEPYIKECEEIRNVVSSIIAHSR